MTARDFPDLSATGGIAAGMDRQSAVGPVLNHQPQFRPSFLELHGII